MKEETLMTALEKDFLTRLTNDTTASYIYSIRRFVHRYPQLKRITISEVEEYFREMKRKNYSVGYRNSTLAAIKALFEYLLNEGEIRTHPCRTYHIDEKRPSGKDFGSLLTMEEMELMLTLKEERYQYVGNRNKAMIGLLIYQGLTSKELVILKTSSIDLEEGIVKVRGGNRNKSRVLQLKPSQILVLMRYVELDRPHLDVTKSVSLFLTMRGVRMTTDSLHSFTQRLGGAFDKDVSPMNIRNSVISYWLNERKIPLEDVQIMAGHRYPSSTEMYIRPDIKEQREAVSRLHHSIFEM